jgi:hypothetical protein
MLNGLPVHVRNAIRLLGGAALPAHFPPYVGLPAYRELTRRRQAAILRNSRQARRYFRPTLPDSMDDACFAHGLYLTPKGASRFDESMARRAATGLSDDLKRAGFPIRHAGSFGFDFAATEWFRNPATGHQSVRVAVPDIPAPLWNDLVASIAKWWSTHCGSCIAAQLREALVSGQKRSCVTPSALLVTWREPGQAGREWSGTRGHAPEDQLQGPCRATGGLAEATLWQGTRRSCFLPFFRTARRLPIVLELASCENNVTPRTTFLAANWSRQTSLDGRKHG